MVAYQFRTSPGVREGVIEHKYTVCDDDYDDDADDSRTNGHTLEII